MKLILGCEKQRGLSQCTDIASFVVYDRRSLPVIFGAEYRFDSWTARTFASIEENDFYTQFQRSGLDRVDVAGMSYGVVSLRLNPFLGKGVPVWTAGISRLIAVNDHGKNLFAACLTENGKFVSLVCGSEKFEQFVHSLF